MRKVRLYIACLTVSALIFGVYLCRIFAALANISQYREIKR